MTPIRDYAVMDLETTGLNPRTDRIIEIGCMVVTDGVASPAESCLIQYEGVLPERITEITGIKAADLAEAGIPLADGLWWLLQKTVGVPLVGHNILAFDLGFWAAEARRVNVLPAPAAVLVHDTAALYVAHKMGARRRPDESLFAFQSRVMARRPRGMRYNLALACGDMDIDPWEDALHRAAADVTVTQRLFEALMAAGVLDERVMGEAVRL